MDETSLNLFENVYGAGLDELGDLMGGGKLRPFFCRIGSKRDLAERIIKLIPSDITTYVEPFIGGGAVLWVKEPHQVEVINDLDSELIQDYKLLKSIKSRDFPQGLDTQAELQAYFDRPPRTEVGQLTRALIRRCNGWLGREATKKIYQDSNPYSKLKKINDYQERLKKVIIKNSSYEKVIKEYDSPTTLFYCDPPYEAVKQSENVYKHGEFNQEQLKNDLSKIRGKFLVSINDSKYIRTTYKGFYYIAFTVSPKGGNLGIGGKPRKELFIANYPISKKKL